MVKKTVIFFIYIVFFLVALLYIMPKDSLYFYAEKKLKKYDIIINKEKVVNEDFGLEIRNAQIYFNSILNAKVYEANTKIYIVNNSLEANKINLSSVLKSFIPSNIDKVKVSYTVIEPLKVKIYAVGEFGEIDGDFNLIKNNLIIKLKPSKLMLKKYVSTIRMFNKTKSGEYIYVKTF